MLLKGQLYIVNSIYKHLSLANLEKSRFSYVGFYHIFYESVNNRLQRSVKQLNASTRVGIPLNMDRL
jgi:hypothetical protein